MDRLNPTLGFTRRMVFGFTHVAFVAALVFAPFFIAGSAWANPFGPPPEHLECTGLHADVCALVLPTAKAFYPATSSANSGGAPWWVGTDGAAPAATIGEAGYEEGAEGGTIVGWVMLSTDAVPTKGYSGKPLVTVVGIDPQANITGARVIHHNEPILLVGIPEKALTDFTDFYAGKPAVTKVVVGNSSDPEAISVDMISGATVTVLAQNQTILETARRLGVGVGVIAAATQNIGEWVPHPDGEVWDWARMNAEGALGHMRVTEAQMGVTDGVAGAVFLDLYFAIANAPPVGRGLLGSREYAYQMKNLAPGELLMVALGNGSSSFKGSGFVRGGIFDRVRLEQGLGELMFRDKDYTNLSGADADDAPRFKEGAIFVIRGGKIDPGAPFTMVFTGSRYDGQGGFHRAFEVFKTDFQQPASLYKVEAPVDLGLEIVAQAWHNQRYKISILIVFLLIVLGLFIARKWLTGDMKRLRIIHTSVMVLSFLVLGIGLSAQPSVTQVLTVVGGIFGGVEMTLFLSEPLLFVFWTFIAITSLIWGRGLFCGWLCPYGSMSELLFKLGRKLHLPEFELGEWWHRRLRYIRYAILIGLVALFLVDPVMGEQAAEIEPFKSTFFVLPWERAAIFFIWWIVLLVPAMVWHRPYCRYICPLGAALAIPNSTRFAGPLRRNFCTSCTICTKGCEPRAIRPDGSIDPRECLSCMECEANYREEEVCPPLIAMDRLRLSGANTLPDDLKAAARLAKAQHNMGTVRGWNRPQKAGK